MQEKICYIAVVMVMMSSRSDYLIPANKHFLMDT